MRRIIALSVAALALAGCDQHGGWYVIFTCQERDLKSGLCIKATYSCADKRMLVYWPDGTVRCYDPGLER